MHALQPHPVPMCGTPPAGLGFLGVYFAMCMLGGDVVQAAQGAGNLFVSLVTYPYQVAAGLAALALAVFMVRTLSLRMFHLGALCRSPLGTHSALACHQNVIMKVNKAAG